MRHSVSFSSVFASVSSLAIVGALALGCGSSAPTAVDPTAGRTTSNPPAPTAASSSASTANGIVRPGEAKIGDKSYCLISKEEFVVDANSPKVTYEGKTYYFCCPHCAETFEKDPKKYLSP